MDVFCVKGLVQNLQHVRVLVCLAPPPRVMHQGSVAPDGSPPSQAGGVVYLCLCVSLSVSVCARGGGRREGEKRGDMGKEERERAASNQRWCGELGAGKGREGKEPKIHRG